MRLVRSIMRKPTKSPHCNGADWKSVVEKGRVQQQQKKLDQKRSKLDWGVPLDVR